MKASKIASIAYFVLLALSAVVLVLFFCVGFGNMESLPSGYYKSPQFTDLLMYWMYALAAICGICTLVGAVTAPTNVQTPQIAANAYIQYINKSVYWGDL